MPAVSHLTRNEHELIDGAAISDCLFFLFFNPVKGHFKGVFLSPFLRDISGRAELIRPFLTSLSIMSADARVTRQKMIEKHSLSPSLGVITSVKETGATWCQVGTRRSGTDCLRVGVMVERGREGREGGEEGGGGGGG